MAGAADKKRSQLAASTIDLYTKIIIGLYVAYFTIRVLWCWSSFGFLLFVGLFAMSVINYLALGAVKQALELGAPVTGPQDILFVNWAVMGLGILTDKAYYLYLVIPAYLIYQYGGFVKNYFFPSQPAMPVADTTEADLKRQAKKERQAAMNERRRGGQ